MITGILARTEKHLRHQGHTEIPYAFEFPPVSFRTRAFGDFEDPTCKNAPQRRPPDIQDRAFLMTLSPCLGPKDPQAFHQIAVVWKNLEHPNVVPLLGITTDPIQLVSCWMPDTDLTGYTTDHPDTDRSSLVDVPLPYRATCLPLPYYLMSRKASITSTPATSYTGISGGCAIFLARVTTGILTLKVHTITRPVSVSLVILRNFRWP